jgi:Smg protein
MKEELFEVLMYLFENHMRREQPERVSQETLFSELADAGFTHDVIDMAFEWLDGVAALHIAEALSEDHLASSTGFRVFSREEISHFGHEICSQLMKFEQLGILNANAREIVINRLFAIDMQEIDQQRVKWLVLMVLIDDPENETALATLEQMMKTEVTERFH